MRRTLQEWANFLKMYVFMNADGSVYASEKEPKLSSCLDPSLREPLKCKSVYWDCNPNIIHIDKEGVDYSEFSIVNLKQDSSSRFSEYYYIGWESSLRSPSVIIQYTKI